MDNEALIKQLLETASALENLGKTALRQRQLLLEQASLLGDRSYYEEKRKDFAIFRDSYPTFEFYQALLKEAPVSQKRWAELKVLYGDSKR